MSGEVWTGDQHYAESMRFLRTVPGIVSGDASEVIALAQVHATLALACAVSAQGPQPVNYDALRMIP